MVNTKNEKSKGDIRTRSPQSPIAATRSPRTLRSSPSVATSRRSNNLQSPTPVTATWQLNHLYTHSGNTKTKSRFITKTPEHTKRIRIPSLWAVQIQKKLKHKNLIKTLIL